ncbi:unnamed protein product [Pleuronectes platessa]|uniref:Uncharacterized protein n=1 Tax=Pleuronectes platessa TaxID=8262 RepID=A0A9N7UPE3_PLEPL|nr:unnamed protein product [Pleuronectes platessa]
MDYIGRTAEQVKADCQAHGRQNRESTGDKAHEKLGKLQPLEGSYCYTNEEVWQEEDGEEESDLDEDTQQSEDYEEDSESLSTSKILTETDLQRYYKEVQEAYIIKQQMFASELQFERTNNVLPDELEKLTASNTETSQRYEAENLRAGQQASHLKAEF